MHSLLSPSDRKTLSATKPPRCTNMSPLTEEETSSAFSCLVKDIRFSQVDRQYADPPLSGQKYVLVSFVPSKGATPDADNIFGMMKVRGVFGTEEEANERSEFLIRNIDSYHDIYTAFVGRPFPVTTTDGFSQNVKTIDIRKKTTELISEDILSKKYQEKNEMEEIQRREKELLSESKKAQNNEPEDPFDVYIRLQVKKAQILWTYHETKKKMIQMQDIIHNSKEEIRELDQENPDFLERYREKYMEARRQSGIKDDDDSFLKYLGKDLEESEKIPITSTTTNDEEGKKNEEFT